MCDACKGDRFAIYLERGAGEGMGREHLASLIDDTRRRGRETAVVEHRGVRHLRTSYGEIAELAGRFAAELRRREIGAGERVALWGGSSAEWMGAFFGCVLRGVIVVPLDAAGTREFVERVIADTRARLVFGDAELLRGFGGILQFPRWHSPG